MEQNANVCERRTFRQVYIVTVVRRAFSLVELLVVLALIAVLAALLLPTLGRAREAASRAVCLSNLRQTHLVLLVYATNNKDQLPLGFRDGTPEGIRQFNSMVYSGTSKRFVLFGLLQQAGLLNEPAALYCPSEADPARQYNTPENPFPSKLTAPSGSLATRNIQAGYGGRPDNPIPDDPALWNNRTFMRLSDLRRQALVADLTATPARLASRHRDGINVLYADGSARWMPRKKFSPELDRCATLSTQYNADQAALWSALDRQ
jgi:prepilin-type N-terminal cleavage/methylation domain-containing protein/prepilin-type processing-associated H-X9-DG protein